MPQNFEFDTTSSDQAISDCENFIAQVLFFKIYDLQKPSYHELKCQYNEIWQLANLPYAPSVYQE